MFTYKTSIHLRDTDATGVLYFSEQFRIALETFEHFLRQEGISLQKILQRGSFLLPIVHAEGDYGAPLMVDDEIEVRLSVSRVGASSFTLESHIVKGAKQVGKVAIVHVSVDQKTRQTIPLPQSLLTLLQALGPAESVQHGSVLVR